MLFRRITIPAGCLLLLLAQTSLAWQIKEGPASTISADPVGKPKQFKTGEGLMAAVWYEGGTWFFKVTAPKGAKGHHFTGSIRVEGDKIDGEYRRLNKSNKRKYADWIFPHANGQGFDFQFYVNGGVDEVHFKAGPNATSIGFKIHVDDAEKPTRILIGGKGKHPKKSTFSLPAHPVKM